jgi:hypothetical protein
MGHGVAILAVRFAKNECSAAHMAANQAFGFKFRIGVGHRGAVNTKLHGKFTARRDAISRAQIPCVYQGANLVAQLDVQRNVAFRLQVDWNHWHSPPDQCKALLCQIKSQFVFSRTGLQPERVLCSDCDLDCLFRQSSTLPADLTSYLKKALWVAASAATSKVR